MVGTRPGFVSSFTKAVVPAPSCPPIKHINKPDNNNTSRVSNCLIMAMNVATTIIIPAITMDSPICINILKNRSTLQISQMSNMYLHYTHILKLVLFPLN